MLDTRISTLVSPTLDFKSNLCLFHLDPAHEPAWCERLVTLSDQFPARITWRGAGLACISQTFLVNPCDLYRGWFTVATVNLGSAKYLLRSCVGSRQKPQFSSRLDAFREPSTPFRSWEKNLPPGQLGVRSQWVPASLA